MSFQFNVAKEKDAIKPSKAIIINLISDTAKEDELELEVDFSLLPSKLSFSKINLDLYFQENLLKSIPLHITSSALLADILEVAPHAYTPKNAATKTNHWTKISQNYSKVSIFPSIAQGKLLAAN